MYKKFLHTLSIVILTMTLHASEGESKPYCCASLDKMKNGPLLGQSMPGDGKMCSTHAHHPYPMPLKSYCHGVTMRGDCEKDKGGTCCKLHFLNWKCKITGGGEATFPVK